jgi:hypothetical protein
MARITDFGFEEEVAEEVLWHKEPTNFPKPYKRWRLMFEVFNQAIEEVYFWTIDDLKEECGFIEFDKITDVFAASEQSAFFGVSQQRLGLQQDKVTQFLATIGKMVKDLFQLVRELRILDERLQIYGQSYEGDEPSEISLKGYWIDLVEGGAKNPASVYGMSRELGFATLPDLFFAAPYMKSEKVKDYVDSLAFNRKVKEVLMRKLKTFLVWKEHTYGELKNRRVFTVKYLRQHYDVIRMYMQWVKPYLRNIKRMHMDQTKMDTPHLISAFEGSFVEIEVLAKRPFSSRGQKCYGCILLHIDYRTRPDLKFQQEGYQRGPLHVGKTIMTVRSYAWTEEEIARYKAFKAKEDFDLLSSVDSSVQAAYTSLGEELERYLREAGETFVPEFKKEEERPLEKPKVTSIVDPFVSVGKGVGELFGAFAGGPKEEIKCPKCGAMNKPKATVCTSCKISLKKPTKKELMYLQDAREKAELYLFKNMYTFIKRFKAARAMVY